MLSPVSSMINPDWGAIANDLNSLTPMSFEGPYHNARRCIDAPVIGLSPVEHAATYDVVISPLTDSGLVLRAHADGPSIDLRDIWAQLPLGLLQLTGRAFDASGTLLGVTSLKTLSKAPDWDNPEPAALDYEATAAGVLDYLCNGLPPAPHHPDDPAYMWHAAVHAVGTDMATDLQFPALCFPMMINLFLTGHRLGLGDDLIERSIQLADFLIDRPMVEEGPLAGLPKSTMDQEGRGSHREPDRTTVVRIGWTGVTMLDLAGVTGIQRYADYASHLGEVLLATQQDDGSWPYRLRISDGEVVETYTAASVMALFLMERLAEQGNDARYQAAFDRGLDWILANPVQTGLWQQMYEDVPSLEPYENLEQWAPLETAILLLRRQHPDAVSIARKLVRYVEDQFVLFGDESSLSVPYLPFTPCVMEQYRCYWPMDVHTANYVRAALALYEATGEMDWARKAIAAANTVVRCRRPDGRLSTLVPDRRFGTTPPFADWFNCMAHAANILFNLGPKLTTLAAAEMEDSPAT